MKGEPDYRPFGRVFAESCRKRLKDKTLTRAQRKNLERDLEAYSIVARSDWKALCRLFDTTVFNYMVYAYAQEAMKATGLDKETRRKVQSNIHMAFDHFTADQVLKRFKPD